MIKKQLPILLLMILYGSLSFAADIKYYDSISPYFIEGNRLERKIIVSENDESKNIFVKASHLEMNIKRCFTGDSINGYKHSHYELTLPAYEDRRYSSSMTTNGVTTYHFGGYVERTGFIDLFLGFTKEQAINTLNKLINFENDERQVFNMFGGGKLSYKNYTVDLKNIYGFEQDELFIRSIKGRLEVMSKYSNHSIVVIKSIEKLRGKFEDYVDSNMSKINYQNLSFESITHFFEKKWCMSKLA